MNFEKSETYQNLEKALTGEAIAHTKYQIYKSKLSDFNKGYDNILDEIIHNEKEHFKIWFKLLHNEEVPENETNLIDAIKGEANECHKLYIEFGRTARTEGYDEIADLFFKIAKIECSHRETFKEIKDEITDSKFYEDDKITAQWKCLNCGYIIDGKTAPSECPVCHHPQKYFTKED